MKKKLIAMLIVSCVLASGCGTGVSQDEYTAVVEERDKLKEENEKLKELIDLRSKIAEYQARIDAEYEHAKLVIYVAGKVSDNEIETTTEEMKGLRDDAINSIETVKRTFNDLDSLMDISDDIRETTSESIDGIYESWGDFYSNIKDVEKYLTNN
mgnify:CR=1 FL=1